MANAQKVMLGQEKKDLLYNMKLKFAIFFIYLYLKEFLNFQGYFMLSNNIFLLWEKKNILNFFDYKYYKIFKSCKLWHNRVSYKKYLSLNNNSFFLVHSSFRLFYFKFYCVNMFIKYKLFFKNFFLKFKNFYYKNYNNRMFFNLNYFSNIYLHFIKKKMRVKKVFLHNLDLKKKIIDILFDGNLKKKKFYRPFDYRWVMKRYGGKKRFKGFKFIKNNFFVKIAFSKRSLNRNFKLNKFFYFSKNLNYYFLRSFYKKEYNFTRLIFIYNLLFLNIFLKLKKKIKYTFNFFKYFLIAKNRLKRRYKKKKFYCFLKKVRSNSFLTIINGFGEVIFSFSAGRLNLVTKKYKRSYHAMKLFLPLLVKQMKRLFIKKILFLLNLKTRRSFFYKIRKVFRRSFLRVKPVLVTNLPHNNILKTKKLRKVKRK